MRFLNFIFAFLTWFALAQDDILANISTATIAPSKPAIVESDMTILWSGIPAGRWQQKIAIDNNSYQINGNAQTIGLVGLIFPGNAEFKIDGKINGTEIAPNNTKLQFKYNKQTTKLELEFENKNLVKQILEPTRKDPQETGRIPIEPLHLQNIIDPFAALILPVAKNDIGNGKKICQQNLEVFDGRRRMNLKFSYKTTRHVAMAGHASDVFVCNVQFSPVAGHRKESRSTKFMADNQEIEVTLTQIGNMPYYTLFSFSSPLLRGKLTILPSKFSSYNE